MPGSQSQFTGAAAPRVSVISPFHNRRTLLPALLDTLQQQTYADYELIIVDDGSTDGLEEAVGQVSMPFAIQFVRLAQNRGAASARNSGIDAARGHYVALLDSDDAWHPDKLRRQVAHLESRPPEIVSLTRQKVVAARNYVTPAQLMTGEDDVGTYLFLKGGVIQSSMMMLSRSLAAEVRFEDGSRGHDDWSFALRLQQHGARFEMLAEPLTLYNDAGDRPRRSPAHSAKRLEWLGQRRAQLGERAYWAAVAAVASHIHGDPRVKPLKLIGAALRNHAISTPRATYYVLSWAFPPARNMARHAHQRWSAAKREGDAP